MGETGQTGALDREDAPVNKPMKDRVTKYRAQLQNPYALLEYLEEPDGVMTAAAGAGSPIAASRRMLEDPYAYLDGEGGFSVASAEVSTETRDEGVGSSSDASKSGKRRRYSKKEIEAAATELQRRLWRERSRLWDGAPPINPLEVLDIRKALGLLGYELVYEAGLGHDPRTHIEVAGLIDRSAKQVKVSMQFLEPAYQRFTLAHELGHAVLHPEGGGIHRDRPLNGERMSREPDEREADLFATYFLMPAKLVQEAFLRRFGTTQFVLTDDTAFALARTTSDAVLEQHPTSRQIARALAAAERYDGRTFKSLADQFGVSVGAMGIRLDELGLV